MWILAGTFLYCLPKIFLVVTIFFIHVLKMIFTPNSDYCSYYCSFLILIRVVINIYVLILISVILVFYR